MAHTGKPKPPVFVIPNPLRSGMVPEALPVEIEYFQEDFVKEIVDCHGLGR
jgi:hypothetical protein